MNSSDYIENIGVPTPPNKRRFLFLWIVFWVCIIGLVSRSFYLQIVHGSDFRETAEHNRIDVALIPAARGILFDRYKKPLVENISSTDLVIDPRLLPSEEHEPALIDTLARLLPDTNPTDIQGAIHKARATQQPVLLIKALDHNVVLEIQEVSDKIVGAKLVSALVRKYPYGHSAAHILGYTSSVTAQELEDNETLYPTDTTGKQGVELIYENVLRGRHGAARTEINAAGKPQTDLGSAQPTPGQDIQLTLDIELQEFIYSLFSERDKKQSEEGKPPTSGAVIAIDPRSGEVLAMVNYPSYDPNSFSQPSKRGENSTFFTDTARPLFNRAISGTFASGSVIKPFISLAALEEGIITPQTTFLSTGGIQIGPWSFPDWKAGGHGPTDVKKAIAESVNTFFYLITGGDEERTGLGVQKTIDYLAMFGWGSPTGIDLPSEAAGLLPNEKWKEEVKGERWYIGDTYHLGIGQGDVLVTPLQIAHATAGIANGQWRYTPHLVNTDDVVRHEVPGSMQNIQVVREGMRQTVTDGSGVALKELPIPLAGKTGTAQVGGDQPTHAWFTSFGPYEEPSIVLTVLLEKGGEGDKDAVPFAKEIWQWWAQNRT